MPSIESHISGSSAATTASDITFLIKELERKGYKWVPVGGAKNNVGPIQVSAESSEALNERITNSIDAMLEREWLEHHSKEAQPNTPREAAEAWFKIPKGQVSNLSRTDRRKLGENIRVVLYESGIEKSPTLVIRDLGIGQNPDDFADTLLSLNRDNKIHLHFEMGAYGQGGAAVYPFAKFSIITSRRVPSLLSKGQSDLVGWTIVRYNPLDADHKTGRYEYIVTSEGKVPTFDPRQISFEPGTEVRLVQYELPRHHTIFTAPSSSLWALTNMVLYDPVLPFLIGDERTGRYQKLKKSDVQRTRVITGNANRLREKSSGKKTVATGEEEQVEGETEDVRYHNEETINLGQYGKVKIKYWIFAFKKGSKTSPVDAYSDASSAIAVTLNGQRQEKFDRGYFRTYLNLHILRDYMLVQVDCDLLTKEGKKELFSSTRDRIKRSSFLDSLLSEMNDIIKKDQQVEKITAELRQAALLSASSEENLRLSHQLDELIKEWDLRDTALTGVARRMMGDTEGSPTIVSLKRGQEVEEAEEEEDDTKKKHRPDILQWNGKYFPTEFGFQTSSDPLRIPIGKPYALYLESNAVDDCLTRDTDRGELEWSVDPLGSLLERSRSQMRSGRVSIRLVTPETANPDTKVRVKATLSFSGRPPLVAERDAVFLMTRKGKRKLVQVEGRPDYSIVPVVRVNDHWETDGKEIDRPTWTEETVSEVDSSGKSVIIYVNMSNKDYLQAQLRRNVGEGLMRKYSERYQVAIAFHSVIQERAVKEMAKSGKPAPTEEALQAEMQRAVRTVIFTTFVAPEEREILVQQD